MSSVLVDYASVLLSSWLNSGVTVISGKIVFYCMTQPYCDECQRCAHRCGTDDKSIEQLQLRIISYYLLLLEAFLPRLVCLSFLFFLNSLLSVFCSRDLQLYVGLIVVISFEV